MFFCRFKCSVHTRRERRSRGICHHTCPAPRLLGQLSPVDTAHAGAAPVPEQEDQDEETNIAPQKHVAGPTRAMRHLPRHPVARMPGLPRSKRRTNKPANRPRKTALTLRCLEPRMRRTPWWHRSLSNSFCRCKRKSPPLSHLNPLDNAARQVEGGMSLPLRSKRLCQPELGSGASLQAMGGPPHAEDG